MFKSIIVRHEWHVNSYGFKTWEIEADTEKELEYKRLKLQEDNGYTGIHSNAFKEIKILPSETHKLKLAQRLTLKERLLGRVLFEREIK